MAKKRFTDIEIWDREWYMELKPVHKCLMKYIFDKCDACGCWKPNWKLASLHIGENVTYADLSSLPKHQYEVLESGKIFIPDFVNFQYGQLSKKSPAHNPVFLAIEKNNLTNRVFNRVSDTLKEKDIYKEEEKDKEEEEEKKPEIKKKDLSKYPLASSFNGLPEIQIGAAIELIRACQNCDATTIQIESFWNVFKIQHLTGENFYQSVDKVYNHFINWVKDKKINSGQQSVSKNKLGNKSGGFGILANALNKNQ